jgi:hypothetical protein
MLVSALEKNADKIIKVAKTPKSRPRGMSFNEGSL